MCTFVLITLKYEENLALGELYRVNYFLLLF